MPRPSVYTYLDYRVFLRDIYQYLKKESSYFSYRYFSRKAGFRSQSVLHQVMKGHRNIAVDRIARFSAALGLREREREYFRLLVLFNQAGDSEEKNRLFQDLLAFGPKSRIKVLTEKEHAIYHEWYSAAIREVIGTGDFNEDPAWVARRLNPPIRPVQAKRALSILLEEGFISRGKDGRLHATDRLIGTSQDISSQIIRSFNMQMADMGKKAILGMPRQEREISGMTIGCSRKLFDMMKSRIREFKQELLDMCAQESEQPEEVYQINFQAFPLTGRPGKEEQ